MESQKGKFGKYHVKDYKHLFFYPNEYLSILESIKDKPRLYMAFDILLNTGARHNEASNILLSDINFIRKNLTLRITKGGSQNSIPRVIPISTPFVERMKQYTKKFNVSGEKPFPMLKSAWLNTAIKELARDKAKRSDWKDFSVHNIRKTTETWLVALDIDIIKVITHIGHEMIVAARHYVSPDIFMDDDRKLMRSSELLGDLYTKERMNF